MRFLLQAATVIGLLGVMQVQAGLQLPQIDPVAALWVLVDGFGRQRPCMPLRWLSREGSP